MIKISVFGQGKVGLTLTACLADAGYDVTGVDVFDALIESVNEGNPRTDEAGVLERLRKNRAKVRATKDSMQAVKDTDLSFVIVPTPSNTLGGFSLKYVKKACQEIGEALRKKRDYHVIAVISTMIPGSSEHILIPLIEKASGKKLGKGWGFCYNPVFIALGEVVKGFVKPDYVLIGETDTRSGDRVLQVHRDMMKDTEEKTPIARMRPIEAEITKIASNTHETMRVSFANMLFSLCTEIPETNVDRITQALSHRMGKRFFKGAVPYGGPCWPRDNIALAAFMDAVGVPSSMPKTVHQFNLEHGKYVLRKILELTNAGDTIGIAGVAYKPNTPVLDCSFGVDLIGWLLEESRSVVAWDPLAKSLLESLMKNRIRYAATYADLFDKTKTVVLVNPLEDYRNWDWRIVKNHVVIDCWRCLKPQEIEKIKHYHPLGQGPASETKNFLEVLSMERLRMLTD
ncbi:MAG: hypothetical protein A2Z83_06300 [Omnitrophica bacterium GWA2_52_8]|nr:MAG: hypothetical protein A2Z83_06300 [Omnitrophica bacterium GWA2_52_8]